MSVAKRPLRVVLFGEALPRAELKRLHQVIEEGSDLVISIGTTRSCHSAWPPATSEGNQRPVSSRPAKSAIATALICLRKSCAHSWPSAKP